MESVPAFSRRFATVLIWCALLGLVVGCGAKPAGGDKTAKASEGKTEAKSDDELARMRESTLTGQLGEPSDVAQAVAFLCSNAAKHITGQMLSVSGGQWMP